MQCTWLWPVNARHRQSRPCQYATGCRCPCICGRRVPLTWCDWLLVNRKYSKALFVYSFWHLLTHKVQSFQVLSQNRNRWYSVQWYELSFFLHIVGSYQSIHNAKKQPPVLNWKWFISLRLLNDKHWDNYRYIVRWYHLSTDADNSRKEVGSEISGNLSFWSYPLTTIERTAPEIITFLSQNNKPRNIKLHLHNVTEETYSFQASGQPLIQTFSSLHLKILQPRAKKSPGPWTQSTC